MMHTRRRRPIRRRGRSSSPAGAPRGPSKRGPSGRRDGAAVSSAAASPTAVAGSISSSVAASFSRSVTCSLLTAHYSLLERYVLGSDIAAADRKGVALFGQRHAARAVEEQHALRDHFCTNWLHCSASFCQVTTENHSVSSWRSPSRPL